MSLFIGVLISLCFLQVAVALPHANLPYQNVEVRAGSRLVIPCDLTTDGVTGNEKIDFEWGFTPDGSDRYRTIMRRNDVKLHPGMLHGLRVHLHPTHPTQEDCSLIINPLLMEDSGTYEIKVIVNGAQSGPIRRINVHMEDSPLMTTGRKFSARRKAMVQLYEPMAFAEEEQMAAVEEGQTTGKKDDARRIAMIHSPVNTFHAGNMGATLRPEQKLTVEEKQAVAVEQGQARPVDNWKTTGKKYIAKLLGKSRNPEKTTTTDKQTPTAEEKQAPAVEKGQAKPVDNWKTTGKKYISKLLGNFHSPEKTTTDKQTPTAEEKQAPAVEQEQAMPVDNWKTTGKKYIAIAKLLDKSRSPGKTTTDKQTLTAGKKQAPAVKEGQARPVDNWKTTVKKYIAKLLGKFRSPEKTTTTDKQTPTAEKKQASAVEEEQAMPVAKEQTKLVDEGLTTGKKRNARHKDTVHHPGNKYDALGRGMISLIKEALTIAEQDTQAGKGQTNSKQYNTRPKPTVHSPVTTTIHSPVTTTIQATTVDRTPMGLVKRIIKNLKKYAILFGIGLASGIITFIIGLFIIASVVRRYRARQQESSLEEGRGYNVTSSSDIRLCRCCRCCVAVFKVCGAGVCAVTAPVVTVCKVAARAVSVCARAVYAVAVRAVAVFKVVRRLI